MEELEDPTEKLKEIQEEVEENEKKEAWTLHVALSTAIIAVLAAIAGLVGNHHANEAMLDEIKSSNHWAYYQAKSIKSEIATSTAQMMAAIGKPADPALAARTEKYEKEKEEIKKTADEEDKSSEHHMRQHMVFAKSVTIFQIAIAISAIAILTRRKLMWYFSMALSAAGTFYLIMGFLTP